MKRTFHPPLSSVEQETLASYGHQLRAREDPALASIRDYLSDLRHRFGYHIAASVPLHWLTHIMGHGSLNITKLSIRGTKQDLQEAARTITWT